MCKPSIVALLLFWSSVAAAQQVPPVTIDSGTLVRMHLTASGTIRGRLVKEFTSYSPSLTFCPYPGPQCVAEAESRITSLPIAQVTSIDQAVGTHVERGLIIGGLIGAGVGGLFLAANSELCDIDCGSSDTRGFLIPLVLGLGLGAAFGAASTEWAPAW